MAIGLKSISVCAVLFLTPAVTAPPAIGCGSCSGLVAVGVAQSDEGDDTQSVTLIVRGMMKSRSGAT